MYHEWERSKVHTKFWSQNQKGRDHLRDLGISWDNIKMDL